MKLDEIEKKILIGGLIICCLFFLIILGFSSLRLFTALIIFSAPFYIVLGRYNLDVLEKIIFSLFLAIGLVPTLIYLPAFLIGIKLSSIILLILLWIVSILIIKK